MASVLIIGHGGREHAIGVALNASPSVKYVWVSNLNAGLVGLAKTQTHKLNIDNLEDDFSDIVQLCKTHKITMVVIGPERFLERGMVNFLELNGIMAFGPTQEAARIETDKAWAKVFMQRHYLPTAQGIIFEDTGTGETPVEKATNFLQSAATTNDWNGYVIKAVGLHGGKGVMVADTEEKALLELNAFSNSFSPDDPDDRANESIIIEKRLFGFELSLQAVVDKKGNYILLPECQDHKQRGTGGIGKNTGGMGCICPVPLLTPATITRLGEEIIKKAINGLMAEGIPYRGILYAGLIISSATYTILEFNARFGDPETQAILPLMKSDLYELMKAACEDKLDGFKLQIDQGYFTCAVCVVVKCYPNVPQNGFNKEILGLKTIGGWRNFTVYFQGARRRIDLYRTTSGRVLTVVNKGKIFCKVIADAHRGADQITFRAAQQAYTADYRRDIGFVTSFRVKAEFNKNADTIYKKSGVDILAGKLFVEGMKHQIKEADQYDCIGGFGGVFDLQNKHYDDPQLVAGVDGVGTKLMIAAAMFNHKTIGIDLVAMCVNDILACGAEPLFFMDYFSTGQLDLATGSAIISGILKGCAQANCQLLGGETAEMPGMYKKGDYDLAGFAIGVANKGSILPKKDAMKEGDWLIGFGSSGLHSNGFSLIRSVIEGLGSNLQSAAPYNNRVKLGDDLLEPTVIYRDLLPLLRSPLVSGAAHITGGGLADNISRIIPSHLTAIINQSWPIQRIFLWLLCVGVNIHELFKTLNMGIGFVIVVDGIGRNRHQVLAECGAIVGSEKFLNLNPFVIGKLETGVGVVTIDESIIHTDLMNKTAGLIFSQHEIVTQKNYKRNVAILISGTGTNMEALIKNGGLFLAAATIILVISNVPDAPGIQKAEKLYVPTKIIDSATLSKKQFEDKLHEVLIDAEIQFICLAGFMKILSKQFVSRWAGRIVNIHPSLLPAFKGMNAPEQALTAGVKVTGCTVHFVTENVDDGKIIAQKAVDVLPGDDVNTLTKRIKEAECSLYYQAITDVVRERITFN